MYKLKSAKDRNETKKNIKRVDCKAKKMKKKCEEKNQKQIITKKSMDEMSSAKILCSIIISRKKKKWKDNEKYTQG